MFGKIIGALLRTVVCAAMASPCRPEPMIWCGTPSVRICAARMASATTATTTTTDSLELGHHGVGDGATQCLHRFGAPGEPRGVHAIREQRDPAAVRQIEPDRRAGEAGVADRTDARPAIARV